GLGDAWSDDLNRGVYVTNDEHLPKIVDLNIDLITGRDQSLSSAMDEFMFCTTWEESRAAVERNEVLLTREAEHVLSNGISGAEAADNAEAASVLRTHLSVLQECRTRGIAVVFAEYCDGRGHRATRKVFCPGQGHSWDWRRRPRTAASWSG